MVVRQATLDAERDAVMTFWAAVKDAWRDCPESKALPIGRAALEPSVTLALNYISLQGMLPKSLTPAEAFEGVPAGM